MLSKWKCANGMCAGMLGVKTYSSTSTNGIGHKKNVILLSLYCMQPAQCTFHDPSPFVHGFVRVSVIFGTFSSTTGFKKRCTNQRESNTICIISVQVHIHVHTIFMIHTLWCAGRLFRPARSWRTKPRETHEMNRRKFNYERYFGGNDCSRFHRMQRQQSVRIHPFFIPNKVICTGTK